MKSTGGVPPEGDVMSSKFSAANKLATLLAAGAAIAIAFATPASADTKKGDSWSVSDLKVTAPQ